MVTLSSFRVFVMVACTVLAACSKQTAPPDVNAPLRIEPLTIGASEPSFAPQLTITGDRAVASWIETQERTRAPAVRR